jgi:uncharacterized protein (TIGR02391 family)
MEAVWEHFRKKGTWPYWHDLKRPLKRTSVDPRLALEQLSEQLVITPARRRPSVKNWPEGEVRLSVASVSQMHGSEEYLRSLFGLIDLLAEVQQSQALVHGQAVEVSTSDLHYLRQTRSSNDGDSPSFVAIPLAYGEPWCAGGSLANGWAGTETTVVVDHRVQPFAGASDIHDYWRRRREAIEAPMGSEPRALATAPSLGAIHPVIADASAQLYRDDHFTDAVLRAFKAVEHRVQQATGSSEIGQRLMNSTFGGTNPQLDVAKGSGPSAAGEQDGHKMLFMGAMVGIRNVLAHGDHRVDDADEARDAIAFASLLMRRIDRSTARLGT